MDVDVFGRKNSVPEAIRAQAQVKVAKIGRLAPVLERAEVRLVEDRDAPAARRHLCEVTMEGHGHVVRARARASELQAAVDLVVEKLEHQVERLKGKLLGRSHPRRSKLLSKA
ncbi:MAG TPA: ribosome-associated translation inhibitor RaiA [Acidimicrobiales bacterium]|nr:ribosome-associated translation inhibitor RaiA [Acidimicrobiales bacterium]